MTTSASTALTALSDELAGAVERIAPSVVGVDGGRRRSASGLALDEHLVVTVDHALDRDDDIELALAPERTATASVVARDPATDLALLRTEARLVPLALEAGAALRVGMLALAVARDDDGAPGASFGIVSALDGPWRTWRGGEIDRWVRPDLNLYSGFSGGPLVAADGTVLGINTWGLSRRSAITIPNATVLRVVEALRGGAAPGRGYLGVALQSVGLPEALRARLKLQQPAGAIVLGVAPGGPAEQAGVALGDVIVALGTAAIEDAEDLQRVLGASSVGTSQNLLLIRGGELQDFSVVVGRRER